MFFCCLNKVPYIYIYPPQERFKNIIIIVSSIHKTKKIADIVRMDYTSL